MSSRLTRAQLDALVESVTVADPPSAVAPPEVITALYRLLGFGGQPVTPARLASATGRDEAGMRVLLEGLPNIEWDGRGAVTGCGGLSLTPTAHRVVIAGRAAYAWCAWDTLFLPVALGTSVDVRSHCPHTRRPITLTVTPTGISDCDPASAVLTFVHPEAIDRADVRTSFCDAVHFLAEPATARAWSSQHDADPLILELDDAFELGRRMIDQRCGSLTRPDSGS